MQTAVVILLLLWHREVSRETELHGTVLAFSVSHDHGALRIYDHYTLIDENETRFYRYPIRKFDFTEQNGKDKWTAYKFVKNVYYKFAPMQLERIRTAIDELPDPDPQPSQQSVTESAFQLELNDSQSTSAYQILLPLKHLSPHPREPKSKSPRHSVGDGTQISSRT